ARFHRKTHCYSHSIEMVEYSLLLLIYKDILLSMLC
ncbi:MAG: IS1 family transposase, partial [Candidatus Peribacteria bacterium]|nr:IS1 family transposase [Candidatus Peribacteria bacterium]MDR0607262.1 IS1 family transposase [Candidatus Peribacteria bacterium]MDR0607503.1 IS1 family transposase [Candidatus Peribacteria bacterium]